MKKVKLTQSAYPVLVLRALETGYKNYDEMQKYIQSRYKKHISTKTIYRHIKLIKSLGFKIVDESPYVIWPSDKDLLVADGEKFGHAAYPLMMLVVLQSERKSFEEIIDQINLIYKTKIERKAIGRNMKILGAIGYYLYDSCIWFSYQVGECE